MSSKTSAIGRAGEHLVILDLLAGDVEVFASATEGTQTDLVAATSEGFKRIQVKTVSDSSKGVVGLKVYKETLHRSRAVTYNYLEAGIIDIFAIAVLDRRCVVYVAATELRELQICNGATFRFELLKNKQPRTRLVADYTWERALRLSSLR